MPAWILLLALSVAPLALLAVRCLALIARLLGSRRQASATGELGAISAARLPAPVAPRASDGEWSVPSPGTVRADSRPCAVCGGEVLALAHTCRHCGASLVR